VSETSRPTGEQVLAKLQPTSRARLRIYIGAAPGVGKTYSMIEDAHALRREGTDVVVGFVDTHGRADTEARLRDLEVVPRRRIEYRGVMLEEMARPERAFDVLFASWKESFSADIGLTRAARRAGISVATSATAASTIATSAITIGSAGFTP